MTPNIGGVVVVYGSMASIPGTVSNGRVIFNLNGYLSIHSWKSSTFITKALFYEILKSYLTFIIFCFLRVEEFNVIKFQHTEIGFCDRIPYVVCSSTIYGNIVVSSSFLCLEVENVQNFVLGIHVSFQLRFPYPKLIHHRHCFWQLCVEI
ncbi:hypothetical protein Tco_0475108 [Tanacetum coccineum]